LFFAVSYSLIFPESWKSESLHGTFNGNIFKDLRTLLQSPNGWGSAFQLTCRHYASIHVCLSQSSNIKESAYPDAQIGIFILPSDVLKRKIPPRYSEIIAVAISESASREISLDWISSGQYGGEYLVVPFRLFAPNASISSVPRQTGEKAFPEFCLSVASNIDLRLCQLEDTHNLSVDISNMEDESDEEDDALLHRVKIGAKRAPQILSTYVPGLEACDIIFMGRRHRKRQIALTHRYVARSLPALRVYANVASCDFRFEGTNQEKYTESEGKRYSVVISMTLSGERKGEFEVPDAILRKSTASYLYETVAESLKIDISRISQASISTSDDCAEMSQKNVTDASECYVVEFVISGFLNQKECEAVVRAIFALNVTVAMHKRCEADYDKAVNELKRSYVFNDSDSTTTQLKTSVEMMMETKTFSEVKLILWQRPWEILQRRSKQLESAAKVVNLLGGDKGQDLSFEGKRIAGSAQLYSQDFVLITSEGCGIAQGLLGTKSVFEGLILSLSPDQNEATTFVRGLFVGQDLEECATFGVYSLRLFVRGEWTTVTIDDTLPVDHTGALLFIRSESENQFWAPLIEKALAKIHGGYLELHKCSPNQIAQNLTGSVYQLVSIRSFPRPQATEVGIQTSPVKVRSNPDTIPVDHEAYEHLRPQETSNLNGNMIERTRAKLQCGYLEAVMQNLSLRDFDRIAHEILEKNLSARVSIGAWRSNMYTHKGKERLLVQEGYIYRIVSSKTIHGVPFYQVCPSDESNVGWQYKYQSILGSTGVQFLGHKRNLFESA
jgi:hypothetical protein